MTPLGTRPVGAVLWCVLILASAVPVDVQRAIEISCSPNTPVVRAPQKVRLRAWADQTDRERVFFRWTATVGRIDMNGREVDWTISDNEPNAVPPYRATVRADGTGGSTGTCTVELWPAARDRGPGREAGRTFLIGGQQSPPGYGLYSYLLLGTGPTSASRERYLKTIEAWWSLVPELAELEKYLENKQLNAMLLPQKEQLNAMLLPSRVPSHVRVSPDRLLENYDYARALVLLRAIGRQGRDGPYFVSTIQPLDGDVSPSGPYLFQDLSSIPPTLATAWTKEFINQAAQQRFWDERTPQML